MEIEKRLFSFNKYNNSMLFKFLSFLYFFQCEIKMDNFFIFIVIIRYIYNHWKKVSF